MDTAQKARFILDGAYRVLGLRQKSRFTWLRTGAADFPMIGGEPDQWTSKRIYGDLGRFSLDAPHLPIRDTHLQYSIMGDDLDLLGHVKIVGGAKYLVPQVGPVGSASEIQPVGDMGVTALVSLLPIIWSLLNPRVTLHLPSTLETVLTMPDTDTLLVDFVSPPTVEISWGARFNGQPNSLTLKERSVSVAGKIGWFAKNETWAW